MEHDWELPEDALMVVDGCHGIYAGKVFVERFGDHIQPPLTEDDRAIMDDVYHEEHLVVWDDVLNRTVVGNDGTVYDPYQDGDTWLIPRHE